MFCKQTQEIIDRLLRLKDSPDNKIASLMSKPNRNRKENETLCVSVINEIMDAHKTKNKIASSQSAGRELAEFQSLLKAYIH
jgi:hypothetical protein